MSEQEKPTRKLTDRDLVTAVTEQCNVVHKDYGSGIIRRIEIAADSLLIEFQDTDGYYFEGADKAEEFEWAEGFEDYAGSVTPRERAQSIAEALRGGYLTPMELTQSIEHAINEALGAHEIKALAKLRIITAERAAAVAEAARLRAALVELDKYFDFGAHIQPSVSFNFEDTSGVNDAFDRAQKALKGEL